MGNLGLLAGCFGQRSLGRILEHSPLQLLKYIGDSTRGCRSPGRQLLVA